MRATLLSAMLLFVFASAASADWVYLRDLDRGQIPNEYHANIRDVHLTTEHARDGHVALAFRPDGRGWVTRYNLWHNWTWYDRVAFRMFNANDKPVTFTWEVRTRHGRRANIRVTVQPGANDVVLKFAELTNIAEKPLSLYDVSQWVIFFDEGIPKPLYLSEYRLIRENIQLPWPTEKNIPTHWSCEYGVTVKSEQSPGDPVPEFWASAEFSAPKGGTVWTELRPGEKRFNTLAFPENWLGYDRITFVCDNPQKEPVKLDVMLEDFITRACRDTDWREDKAAAVPLVAQPGRHMMSASLKDLKTVDGRRRLDLAQMYRIGFRARNFNEGADVKLRFSDIRIRTSDENAGILIPREGGRRCVRCDNRLDDANCNCCPFCGKFYNARAVVTTPTKNSVTLVPVKDGYVMASSGGGGPTVKECYGTDPTLSVCHYDVSFWEGRAFLRFDPSTVPAGARIRKAELRLHSAMPGSQGKAWLCPMRVFVAPDGADDFNEQTLNWISQPPIGAFAAQGGLYYYWTDTMALNLTEFLKERLAKSRKPFTLVLRAFEAEPCSENAHLFGHHFPFHAREAKDASKRPQLYVELE